MVAQGAAYCPNGLCRQGHESVFETTEILGASVHAAHEAAQAWLESLQPEPNGDKSDAGSPEGGPALESGSNPDEDQTR